MKSDDVKIDRGPAKGYIEALEARLLETEHVLHRIVSSIPPQYLSTALTESPVSESEVEDMQDPAVRTVASIGAASTTKERKAVVEQWAMYPLHTADDIQLWHNAQWRDIAHPISQTRPILRQPSEEEKVGRRVEGEVNMVYGGRIINIETGESTDFDRVGLRNDRLTSEEFGDDGGHLSQPGENDIQSHLTRHHNDWDQHPPGADVSIDSEVLEKRSSRGLSIPTEFQETFLW